MREETLNGRERLMILDTPTHGHHIQIRRAMRIDDAHVRKEILRDTRFTDSPCSSRGKEKKKKNVRVDYKRRGTFSS